MYKHLSPVSNELVGVMLIYSGLNRGHLRRIWQHAHHLCAAGSPPQLDEQSCSRNGFGNQDSRRAENAFKLVRWRHPNIVSAFSALYAHAFRLRLDKP